MNIHDRKFCVAPMMGYTTPHARKLYRILSKKSFLFTEMIASKSMIHSNNRDSVIENENENPIALQVGGSDYKDLIKCVKIAEEYNYNEINLNVGCPSKTVQKGNFGASLMKEKHKVADCLKAMQDNTFIKVTMKCRIGLGKDFNYNFFSDFIGESLKSEIDIIYVHARNAILEGLSPKNNRNIPPLNYDYVLKIKEEFPHIMFILNGGINSIEDALILSKKHDGVMVGRLVQSNPFCLSEVDKSFYNFKTEKKVYDKIIVEYFKYIKNKLNKESIYRLLSPLLNIFFGVPNSKKMRQEINDYMKQNDLNKLESLFLNFIQSQKI